MQIDRKYKPGEENYWFMPVVNGEVINCIEVCMGENWEQAHIYIMNGSKIEVDFEVFRHQLNSCLQALIFMMRVGGLDIYKIRILDNFKTF